jgi:hypothetical protein
MLWSCPARKPGRSMKKDTSCRPGLPAYPCKIKYGERNHMRCTPYVREPLLPLRHVPGRFLTWMSIESKTEQGRERSSISMVR